jgi:hypothetical protein
MIEHLFGSHEESFEKLSKWLHICRTGLETFIERLTFADTATKNEGTKTRIRVGSGHTTDELKSSNK